MHIFVHLIFVYISTGCCFYLCVFFSFSVHLFISSFGLFVGWPRCQRPLLAIICEVCVLCRYFYRHESFVTVFNVANACHIRISPISLFAFGRCLVFTVFYCAPVPCSHLYTWLSREMYTAHRNIHTDPIHNSILIAGDERYQMRVRWKHWASTCKIAIITQYAIKYLCLIRTSHSRITSSVFTLNARFVSVLSLSFFNYYYCYWCYCALNVCARTEWW